MVENWIKVKTEADCIISFNQCVDIVLDKEDVQFLASKLLLFLLEKQQIKQVC